MEVREALTERAKAFHITLADVAITDLKFGKEFTTAIESKQVAEQDAERARYLVVKAEQEKKASIIRASALLGLPVFRVQREGEPAAFLLHAEHIAVRIRPPLVAAQDGTTVCLDLGVQLRRECAVASAPAGTVGARGEGAGLHVRRRH